MRAEPSAADLAPRVEKAIASMDDRGAWVSPGLLDGPGQLLRVIPANDMIVYYNGKVFPLTRSDDLRVYTGKKLPAAKMVSSGAFTTNMGLFARYLQAK